MQAVGGPTLLQQAARGRRPGKKTHVDTELDAMAEEAQKDKGKVRVLPFVCVCVRASDFMATAHPCLSIFLLLCQSLL